ncbi:MAG: hypothetical protein M1827_003581 [Pycnora praestabilis]|nr:MAG: hypothetical protein M1827_003581 [Pycnora praestabilis]
MSSGDTSFNDTSYNDTNFNDTYLNGLNTTFGNVNPLDGSVSTFEFAVDCIYPISGQYGVMCRILYYFLLVFALVVRNQKWLAAGALASALTYSGAAAIHAFILAGFWHSGDHQFTDTDIWALWCILSTGCTIAVPLLLWSSTLRNERASRPILVGWALLVGAGAISIYVMFIQSGWNAPLWDDALAICNLGDDQEQDALLQDYYGPIPDQWQALMCTSQCGNLQPIGTTPIRQYSNMVPWLLTDHQTEKAWYAFKWLVEFVFPFILAQGLWACVTGAKSPARVRNFVFRFLSGKQIGTSFKVVRGTRAFFAKWIAFGVYLGACAIPVLYGPVFVLNVVMSEINLTGYPEEEGPVAVGQWAPLASTGLALIGAVVGYYYDQWLKAKEEGPSQRPSAAMKRNRRTSWKDTIRPDKVFFSGDKVRAEWKDFKDWFADPINCSKPGNIEQRTFANVTRGPPEYSMASPGNGTSAASPPPQDPYDIESTGFGYVDMPKQFGYDTNVSYPMTSMQQQSRPIDDDREGLLVSPQDIEPPSSFRRSQYQQIQTP